MFLSMKLQWLALVDRLLRKMGFWEVNFVENSYRSNKCEITLSWKYWFKRVTAQLIQDSMSGRSGVMINICMFGCNVFLFNNWLTNRIRWSTKPGTDPNQNIGLRFEFPYGVTWAYKEKQWTLRNPFRLEWYCTRTLLSTNPQVWHLDIKGDRAYFKHGDPRWSESFEFTYVSATGKQQPTTITLTVDQREYRLWCLPFTSLFGRVNNDCAWRSSAELGREAGSHKGGVVGSTVTMLPNETPREAFIRYINRKVM